MFYRKEIVRLLATFVMAIAFFSVYSQTLAPDHFERQLLDRMAASNYAIARTYEQAPVSRLLTYVRESYGIQYTALARIIPQLVIDGKVYPASEAKDIRVEDFPGGVWACFTLGGVAVETHFTPLRIGEGETTRVGAAVYCIKTEPATPVQLLIGESFWQRSSFEDMAKAPFEPMNARDNLIEKSGNAYIISTGEHSALTGVRTSGTVSIVSDGKGNGQYLACSFPGGSGEAFLGFTENKNQLVKLMRTDVNKSLADVKRYYDDLLKNRIRTPDKLLDEAFSSALTTLEYNWVSPYGWVECIHHWTALWHMQHTAAAEWIGQADRSRMTTLSQAETIHSDGSIPNLAPFGFTHRDFGGTNQFWAWQVRHYWNFTGEMPFARQIAPVLDKVIEQTFSEYDKNDNLLLGWGLQIGNQEDYVATAGDGTTSSIEGINMMRTRAELASGLGDTASADKWNSLADEAQTRLKSYLWQADLGRFVYFRDDHANPRLDGQYHTYTYPAIFGISDLLDSYTNLRHVNDRLTDSLGAVYCSNNFPFHAVGTWGMQAGAAQQPWAAWAFSATGLRNLTSQPLHALASWVMDDNHRGSWPEVSTEAVPAYFSPPAGLYVAAVVEAIFGLNMRMPEGYVLVSPNFPDDWPHASLNLKNCEVTFKRQGNRLEYKLHTDAKIARRIKWSLPLCQNVRLESHGLPIPVTLSAGINGIFAQAELPAENNSEITVTYDPIPFSVSAPGSLAEGEALTIELHGAELTGIIDRAGLLGSVSISGNKVNAQLKPAILSPYTKYRNLGQLNFSRRTLFLKGCTTAGTEFYMPYDFTVLPRFEAIAVSEISLLPDNRLAVDVLMRNNTFATISGKASLRIGKGLFSVVIDIAPRSEKRQQVTFAAADFSLFAPGTNEAVFVTPDGETSTIRLIMGDILTNEVFAGFTKANLRPVNIEPLLTTSDQAWKHVRKYEAFYHPPWNACPPPMEALQSGVPFVIPQIPGLSFQIPGRNFATVSHSNRTPVITIPGDRLNCKKLYFLVIPLIDNADMFAQIARITVRDTDGGLVSRTFSFPGDFDWSCPPGAVGRFATTIDDRPLLEQPLALLGEKENDYKEGLTPLFPQPAYWSSSAAVVTPSAVFTVLELDLERSREIDWITVEAVDAIAALGLVGVTGYFADDMASLQDSPWNPPANRMPPVMLFNITDTESVEGWQLEGNAFSVTEAPALFTVPTLNSLVKNGERAMGRALSPAFRVPEWCGSLDLEMQGGTSRKDKNGNETLCIRILDAETHKELAVALSTGVHHLSHRYVDVSKFRGRMIRLELVDRNDSASYAWIGLKNVRFMPGNDRNEGKYIP